MSENLMKLVSNRKLNEFSPLSRTGFINNSAQEGNLNKAFQSVNPYEHASGLSLKDALKKHHPQYVTQRGTLDGKQSPFASQLEQLRGQNT